MKTVFRSMAIALVLLLSLLPIPANASFDDGEQDNGVAIKGDMTLASSPAISDDANGNVVVKLYLLFKGSDVIEGKNLSLFELSPLVDKPADYPFDITWASYTLGLKDQKIDPAPAVGSSDKAGSIYRKYFEFNFKTKKDIVNGTYPIDFKVRFLHSNQKPSFDTPIEDTITVYVKVTNGKEPESASTPPVANPTPKPEAKVILKSYTMNPVDVVGGDSFDLTMVLENTNATMAVRNMKCSIGEENSTVIPESGSSSFFIESIGAGKIHEVTIRMQALPEAGIKPVKITLTMQYTDVNDKREEKEQFTLPIHQIIKLKVDEPYYTPDAYVDEDFDMRLQFYNVGKAAMYNTMVTLESDTMTADASLFVGTLEAGQQGAYEAMVKVTSQKLGNGKQNIEQEMIVPGATDPGFAGPVQPRQLDEEKQKEEEKLQEDKSVGSIGGAKFVGYSASSVAIAIAEPQIIGEQAGSAESILCQGNIVISYEDNFGVQYRKEIPVTVNIRSYPVDYGNDKGMMYDVDYETGNLIDRETGIMYDPMTMLPIERGTSPLVIAAIAGAAVVVIVVALLIILRVRKKKRLKMEMEMEHEVE